MTPDFFDRSLHMDRLEQLQTCYLKTWAWLMSIRNFHHVVVRSRVDSNVISRVANLCAACTWSVIRGAAGQRCRLWRRGSADPQHSTSILRLDHITYYASTILLYHRYNRRWFMSLAAPPFLEQETFQARRVDSRLGENLLTAIWSFPEHRRPCAV